MENRELIYTSLSRGYVDAIAAHEISIRQYMSDFEAKYRILDEDILETGIGVAFAKNDKRGIEKELSKTLKAMVKDGSAKGKIRYSHEGAMCTIRMFDENTLECTF